MNLGKRIVNLRKENKMSQEEFSELFHVTRQTVSSWENSKSYPDIGTLVQISEKFNVSLDVLLKDTSMIKNIDKKVRDNKKLELIVIILIILLSFIIVSLLMHNYLEEKQYQKNMDEYQDIISNLDSLGFSKQDGIINSQITEDNIIYEVYAKFPEVLDKRIMATLKLDGTNIMSDYDGSRVAVTYSNTKNITLYCNDDGSLKNEKQNKNYTEVYSKYKNETTEMIRRMVELYDEVYN